MMTGDVSLALMCYFAAINLTSWYLFRRDKRHAQNKARRISERTLLLSAALGGTLGAFLARTQFRHKTRKQPFNTYLFGIAGLQVVLVLGFVYATVTRENLMQDFLQVIDVLLGKRSG